jgi:tRNA-guanine family transglycosylase
MNIQLQPGTEVIKNAGGLHKFMHRPSGPIITDSGGFQIFSLKHGTVHQDIGALNDDNKVMRKKSTMQDVSQELETLSTGRHMDNIEENHPSELKCFKPKKYPLRSSNHIPQYDDEEEDDEKENDGVENSNEDHDYSNTGGSVLKVTEEGVLFRSYRDGKKILLTPESTIQAQKAYRSDIIIPLDELPPYHTNDKQLLKSVELSHRWEKRSLMEHLKNVQEQAIYGVIHGGVNKEIRLKSIDYLTRQLPEFNGYAIGGSLGCCHEELVDILSFILPKLPPNKPNHLLGIADEKSIMAAVPLGECVCV